MRPTALDRFCADCGLAAPLELEVTAPGLGPSRHALAQPFAVFGRAPDATLVLEDEAVGQRHAYLQVIRGRPFVIDLESRSGLLLDDRPAAAGWLLPGRAVGVGPFRLTPGGGPEAEPPDGNPLEDEVSGPERAALASFDIYTGDRLQARWRMNRALALIGRSTRCRVRLPDTSGSRIHCAVVATPGGAWLVDLLSHEGTLMGGERVRYTRLEEGDRFDVGVYQLRIRYHRPVPAPTAPRAAPLVRANLESAPVVVLGEAPRDLAPPPGALVAAEGPLVGALMQQFSLMQQYMFDQFQQTLVMMAQMMTSMHKEHAALVREEMRQFQRATEEIQELRRQMAERPAAPPAEAPAPAPAAPQAEAPPAAVPATGELPRPRWVPGPWPRAAKAPEPAPAPPLDDGLGPTIAVPTPAAAQAEPAPEAAEHGADAVHAWLSGRIAELESERQSRWQKILGFLKGS